MSAVPAFDYKSIINTYLKLQDQANAANEQRYQDILGTIGAERTNQGTYYDQVANLLEQTGQVDRTRIGQNLQKDLASSEQDLISRGLGNTTIRQGARNDLQDRSELAQQALSEQIANQQATLTQNRAQTDERMTNLLTNVMQARSDTGPNLDTFAQLMMQAAAGQGATDAANKKITNTRVNTAALNAPILSPSQQLAGGSGGGGSGGGTGAGFGSSGGGGGSGGYASGVQSVGAGQVAKGSNVNIVGGSQGVTTTSGGTGGGGGSSGAFDAAFQGQPVYGDAPGGMMGTYDNGQIANQSLLDAEGNLQASRAVPGGSTSGGGDTVEITISNAYAAHRSGPVETRTIKVPSSAMLNGRIRADGAYEAIYKKVMPWGFSQVK